MNILRRDRVRYIVMHYSATYDDQDLGVAEIDKMHRSRGFTMIGYHYVIRLDGTIETGRPITKQGAHVKGYNGVSVGVCVVGGCQRATGPNIGLDTRTRKQVNSQLKLIRDLKARFPGAEIVGHKDLAPTQCPGYDVRHWYKQATEGLPLPVSDYESPYTKPTGGNTKPLPAKSPAKPNESGGFLSRFFRAIARFFTGK